ncbi:DUF3160 domain-containing protein [Sorangium sp. So ce448]|uniref:DUF3160 domain-containing protein n=1 Tax=Sorangium sp. So ce448 TaxID=3133314 RepID=UPI003F61BD3E
MKPAIRASFGPGPRHNDPGLAHRHTSPRAAKGAGKPVHTRRILSTLISVGLLAACSGSTEPGGPGPAGPGDERPADVGTQVQLELSSVAATEVEAQVATAKQHDAASLQEAYAVSFSNDLGYGLTDVQNLDLIQRSELGLNDAELEVLAANGFVVSSRLAYPSFPYAYAAIYVHDLPVFVSGDMVLEAMHRSYDDILQALEQAVLIPRVTRLLDTMRARLASGDSGLSQQAAADADFYLTVARSLLMGAPSAPVAGASNAEIASFLTHAEAADGEQQKSMFGVPRRFDFSQFKPRGHYTDTVALERYFRAMMWMGRIDFRLIETMPDGSRVFWRRQLEAALALRDLMDAAALEDWSGIDRTVTAFVGEHDYMIVPELDGLLKGLGVSDASGLAAIDDSTIAQAIIDGRYGEQRIASHIMRKNGGDSTFPLNASFAFFGQRYVIDSHVFSNVVYDRTATRVVPNPLDAAFAALKNDHAVSLLASELEEWNYAGDLAAVRVIADAHPPSYWEGSLYTSWLGALQTLSANATTLGPAAEGLPSVARSEAWGRRLLNTQLGSWAQLRHDTILYAKQSYTGSQGCDFPDAYVEPYPELFQRIARFAGQGQALVDTLDFSLNGNDALANQVSAYFGTLSRIATTLSEMAEAQRTGMPHSEEHLTFIKQAIHIEGGGSGDPWQTGWYKDLFFDPVDGLKSDPTIADVHTDIGGDLPVPRSPSVLHVGTGNPRMMVMTVDTCQGPRAYAGAVFAYHEHLAEGFTRLTDQEWAQKLVLDPPVDVPWMAPVLAE